MNIGTTSSSSPWRQNGSNVTNTPYSTIHTYQPNNPCSSIPSCNLVFYYPSVLPRGILSCPRSLFQATLTALCLRNVSTISEENRTLRSRDSLSQLVKARQLETNLIGGSLHEVDRLKASANKGFQAVGAQANGLKMPRCIIPDGIPNASNQVVDCDLTPPRQAFRSAHPTNGKLSFSSASELLLRFRWAQ